MMSGRVRFFNDIAGFGYIVPDDFSGILKVSYKEIRKIGYKILNEGQRVEFEIAEDSKGSIAVNVVPLET